MSDAGALAHIGKLIDDAFDASFERGGKRALYLLDELSKRKLGDSDGALAEYFRANAWAALSHIANVRQSWSWEAPERQAEPLALSRASSHAGFASLDKIRRCRILTNHANLLNTVSRTIDAIAVWFAQQGISRWIPRTCATCCGALARRLRMRRAVRKRLRHPPRSVLAASATPSRLHCRT
jgi:hypothetical protein